MGEYVKLTGKPISNVAPSATKSRTKAQTKNKIKLIRKYAGRYNAAELDALMKGQGNRKRTSKRISK